jgi:hypothetical protein
LRWSVKAGELAGTEQKIILKVVGRDILHKTEIGGVRILDLSGTSNPADLPSRRSPACGGP